MNRTTLVSIILNIILFLVIFCVLFFQKKDFQSNLIKRDTSKNFVYTSPILDCESINGEGSTTLAYKEVDNDIDKVKKEYNVTDVSVYFRDLNNGPWIGVNEKEFFSPASLMKTPILIGLLKHAEDNPGLLDTKVVATEEYFNHAIEQNFKVKTNIKKDQTYTLREVAEIMITDSDNVAVLILSKYIKEKDMIDLFKSMGISVKDEFLDIDIRVKDFASFFRVLYNSSYLSREMSELALTMLAQSSFESGIVAGVPKGVKVSHKYGERSLETKDSSRVVVLERQLHDCGIVYAGQKPYILCIMTKGKDFTNQQKAISAISKLIYEKVTSTN